MDAREVLDKKNPRLAEARRGMLWGVRTLILAWE